MRILLSSIYPYVFLLLYLTIPFDNYMRALPNILLIVLAASFPFVVTKEHLTKLKRLPTILFISFVIYIALLVLITGRLELDSPVLQKIGLAIGLVILYVPIQGFKKILTEYTVQVLWTKLSTTSVSVCNLLKWCIQNIGCRNKENEVNYFCGTLFWAP